MTTNLRFGVSLIFFKDEYDDTLQRELISAGVKTIELNARMLVTESQRQAAKGLLGTAALQASSLHALYGAKTDYSSLEPETWQQALQDGLWAVEIAGELDVPIVVMHPSSEPIPPEERPRRFEQAVRGLSIVGEQAKAKGRRIAIEYLPRTCLCNNLAELTALLDRLDKDVFGACLDVNHLNARYAALAEVVRGLGKRLIATHISDCDAEDEKHWLPGKGVLDWPALVRALRDIRYKGPFTYECDVPGDTLAEKLGQLKENFDWMSGL